MRHVGLLVLGSFINSLGTGLTAFGLAVVMLATHGTASSAAAVQLSSFAPIVLLAPAAGALADRYDRRLMMIIGDAGSVLGLSIILLALSSPRPRLVQVCAGAVVSSCLALRSSCTSGCFFRNPAASSGMSQEPSDDGKATVTMPDSGSISCATAARPSSSWWSMAST